MRAEKEHEEATKKINYYHNAHLNDVRRKRELSFLDKVKLKYGYKISPEKYIELLNKYIEYSELEHRYNEEMTRYLHKFLRCTESELFKHKYIEIYTKNDEKKADEARVNYRKYFDLAHEIDLEIMSYGTSVSHASLGWFPHKHLKEMAKKYKETGRYI